ncbi:MAG: hypothetical protein R6U11_00865 [Bacteroidales bacterium]
MSYPYSWDSTKLNLVSIKTVFNRYVNPWIINSAEIKDFYYIAFKISVDDRDILGWMKVSIDKYNGLIEVKAPHYILYKLPPLGEKTETIEILKR